MVKPLRIRDPLHGLIVFNPADDVDSIAWNLINCREFQRLRRIKQLGFSDLVYPGATHTRFAHSVGVYNIARKLIDIIKKKSGKEIDADKRRTVLLAALLHDVGHGPFSHTFEGVTEKAGLEKDHEDWSADIISGDSEIHQVLAETGDAHLAGNIASILKSEENKDIFAAVVSSQFDADRLDYIQRDRLMTGVQFGHVDQDWLFDCLEVGQATFGSEGEDNPVQEECLYLGPKGLHVAEEYLEARTRLYVMVYMHKTTRAAEQMLAELLHRVTDLLKTNPEALGNAKAAQVCRFFSKARPTVSDYTSLDDTVIWADLFTFQSAPDPLISSLAERLLNRKLYKCFDLAAQLEERDFDTGIKRHVKGLKEFLENSKIHFLIDKGDITGYKWYGAEGPAAFNKVLVKRKSTDAEPIDIKHDSKIVQALERKQRIYRFYVKDQVSFDAVEKFWKGARQ